MAEMTVLDVCCGSRMFWFDRDDDRAVYVDKRVERHELADVSSPGGKRVLEIRPNVQADFAALPFPSDYFRAVTFDPPHFVSTGPRSWLRAKYGTLENDWREMLRAGFSECFRVLAPAGILIFKWSSVQIPLSKVLELTPARPLIGHKSGKHSQTHWVTFIKGDDAPIPVSIFRDTLWPK